MGTAIQNGEGVDYSWARIKAVVLKQNGKSFALRYLYDDGQGGKGLDADEVKDLLGGGVELPVVFESFAQRALSGFAAGVVDAQAAQAQLAAVGLPTGMPIYFAVDFDITDSQKPVMGEYLKGAASVIGMDRVGVYGGYYAIKWCDENKIAPWRWQTYAWSGGQWHPSNHLEQYLNGQTVGGGSVDLTRAVKENYGQPSKFGAAVTPSPAPTPVTPSDLVTLGQTHKGYVNAADAAADRNSNSTVSAGTYKITNRSQGMVNVVRMDGTGGWWINPAEASVGVPSQPAGAQYAVQGGDTLGALATRWGTSVEAICNANRAKYPSIGTGSNAFLGAGWVIVNPASGGAVPASNAQFVTVQAGWGLSSVAQAAGYSDAGTPARWAAIAALNGSNDWRGFNAGLKASQAVRVR